LKFLILGSFCPLTIIQNNIYQFMSLDLECRRYGEYQVFVEIKKYPIFGKLQILKVLTNF